MRDRKKSQIFEIAEAICRRTGAPFDLVWPIIQEFVDECQTTLESGKDLRIRGLGSFVWEPTPQKRYHNVSTRRMAMLPAGKRLRWRPTGKLRRTRRGKVRR